jgi:hypothetical protein
MPAIAAFLKYCLAQPFKKNKKYFPRLGFKRNLFFFKKYFPRLGVVFLFYSLDRKLPNFKIKKLSHHWVSNLGLEVHSLVSAFRCDRIGITLGLVLLFLLFSGLRVN